MSQKTGVKKKGARLSFDGPRAMLEEIVRVNRALVESGLVRLPVKITRSLLAESGLASIWYRERLFDIIGETLLETFDSLGPVYGKAAQISLSRLTPGWQRLAATFRLTRLYGDWPAIPFEDVEDILDQEIPHWHQKLKVSAYPLGVASMAQVHAAVDEEGRQWVIKVVKPHAAKRLLATVTAIEQLLQVIRPVVFSRVGKRTIKEVGELCEAFKQEMDLARERNNINRMREKLRARKQQVLCIPQTLDEFCTSRVLVLERFHGVNLSDVVAGKAELSAVARKQLAKKVLQELLLQVFELGVFHGDPHAGNLIVLDSGLVGIFDWGLTGELLESDRRHIAALLKAVMAMDLDRLSKALAGMAEEEGAEVDPEEIAKHLSKLAKTWQKQKDAGEKAGLKQLLEDCLQVADKLGIPIPDGLLMMAKSLLTIEGLARGIDPDISLGRVASPLLLKAARPSFKDLLYLSKRLPTVAGKILKSKSVVSS